MRKFIEINHLVNPGRSRSNSASGRAIKSTFSPASLRVKRPNSSRPSGSHLAPGRCCVPIVSFVTVNFLAAEPSLEEV